MAHVCAVKRRKGRAGGCPPDHAVALAPALDRHVRPGEPLSVGGQITPRRHPHKLAFGTLQQPRVGTARRPWTADDVPSANRAKAEGQSVDEYLKSLLSQNEKPIAPQKTSDAEFEADMEAFAEGTEHLQPYAGTYSRADIYFDHD